MRSAQAAVDCLAVGPDDNVLVLCHDPQLSFPAGERHGAEPPDEVVSAMADATVIFAPTTFSLSHTAARVEATRRGTRMATMPGINDEVFRRALDVDYGELKRAGEALAAQLTTANFCRVRTRTGTDQARVLTERYGISDDGDLSAACSIVNLPAGEAFIAPLET